MSIIKTYQPLIEAGIEKYFSQLADPQGLYDPIKYVMSLGGKRIRPVLCFAGCALFNDEALDNASLPAIGLEIFHNFTLLHDDLMDNSDKRRNNPTVHKKWNQNSAILSGDAMFALAHLFISQAPKKVLFPVIDTFNKTALNVCEGQQLDMDFEKRNDVKTHEYLRMIMLKTGVLLGGSLKIGAIIGGGKKKNLDALYTFGTYIGMMFQLQDDWLDIYGNSEELGKPIGGDIVCNKKTFLLITALNDLKDTSKNELLLCLNNQELDREIKIEKIKNLYEEANISKKVKEKINFFYEISLKSIDEIDAPKEKLSQLVDFADDLMNRRK
ncbi:MAG: polyprenyl synthetase family protein [Marinilabiliaceae bacterium]|nr:polyprenyl synthetase family protein [Marinilabiliaceae bacterium]